MEGPPWVCNSETQQFKSAQLSKALGTLCYLGSSLSLSLAHFHSLTHSFIYSVTSFFYSVTLITQSLTHSFIY